MNDQVITGIFALLSTIFTGIMAYLMARLNSRAKEAAKVGDAVHILVNSNMSAQLKISMLALRRVADLSKHVDDIAAADLATKLYEDHEAKQNIVDQKGLT